MNDNTIEKHYSRKHDNLSVKNYSMLIENLSKDDYVFLKSCSVEKLIDLEDWVDFRESWNNLGNDKFMKDGGKYRYRRHSVYSSTPDGNIELEPHQPHYQSLDYNTLNGGVARHFLPIESRFTHGKTLTSVLKLCHSIFGAISPRFSWHIEVHQFRIIASNELSKPTPEGIHRDGVDFVFMMLISRSNISGGETSICNGEGDVLSKHFLTQPLESAIINDHNVMHGVTPIFSEDDVTPAHRDMLVVTFKKK